MKTNLFFLIFLVLYSLKSLALPAEGFETFGFKNTYDKASQIFVNTGYSNPVWTSDYELMQVYASTPVFGTNYVTFGASGTMGNKFADRDSYFVRYDQTFYNQSLYFKLCHIDENFLKTGKNILSAGYNGAFHLGKNIQFYFGLGAYYRFNLNRWNTPTWNPFNFNTEDGEYYLEGMAGLHFPFGSKNYLTIDLNNRDAFNSYNIDFTALDVAANFVMGKNLTFRIINSLRFTSFFMGTADIGQETFMLGINSTL